jgi:hypothetical protein
MNINAWNKFMPKIQSLEKNQGLEKSTIKRIKLRKNRA